MKKEISELEKLIIKKVAINEVPLKYEIINEEKGQYKLITEDGSEFWYQKHNGSIDCLHREDGPAVVIKNSKSISVQLPRSEWRKFGKIHRENGPAITSQLGEEWFINGLRHREDGPAVVNGNFKVWFKNGTEVEPQNISKEVDVKENIEKIRKNITPTNECIEKLKK